jgi:hypothetical protein
MIRFIAELIEIVGIVIGIAPFTLINSLSGILTITEFFAFE